MNEATIIFTGNLTNDPETRDVGSTQVASFSVAVTSRRKNGDQWEDGATTFYRCSAWRELADNVTQSFHKGDRVIILGRLEERTYTTNDGEERRSMDVTVDEIGASVRYATVQVTRAVKNGNQGQRRDQRQVQRSGPVQRQQRPQRPVQDDPWASDDQYNDQQVAF